jgi:hypothetical protein
MVVSSIADRKEARDNRKAIVQGMASLYDDAGFTDTISRATGDKARTLARIAAVGTVFVGASTSLDWQKLGDVDWGVSLGVPGIG